AKSAYAPKFHSPRLTDVAVDSFGDLVFRHSDDDLLDDLAILEDQQGRDAANVIATGGVHRLVHVQLGHFELASVVASDLRHRWREHMTRAAPFRPKIDQHRLRAACGEHFRLKISVVDGKNIICHVV